MSLVYNYLFPASDPRHGLPISHSLENREGVGAINLQPPLIAGMIEISAPAATRLMSPPV